MTRYNFVSFLSLFGILLAVYLLWQQVYTPAFKPCSINDVVNCDAVISGPVSKTFGVSTPLIGLIGYISIFIGSLIKNKKIVVSMATFGLLFCLYIAYVEFFMLRVICPVCILCQITMISVFALGLSLERES